MGTNRRLFEQLVELGGRKTVIVGVGNTLKGDDAVGPFICEQLAGRVSADLIDAGTVPENYIQPIIAKAPRNLLIIDAIDFGAPPAAINIFKPEQLNSTVISTHVLSPTLFVDMICHNIEVDVYFIGIQPVQTTLGRSLSAQVSQAAKQLIDILAEIFATDM
ncbi:MAG: hydrogenase maturation protease [Planctomycetota bacterium]|jgi:hydrogenase 3 maturation protease